MGARYIEIPANALTGAIDDIGNLVTKAGGSITKGNAGRERTYDLVPHRGKGRVRIYTSLSCGAGSVRGCGEDAVRIVIGHEEDGRFRPHGKGRRIYRTAPKGDPKMRIKAFLDRLTGALREAYGAAMAVPSCPKCESVMALRTARERGTKFWGCSRYPDCKGTRQTAAGS